MAATVSDLEIPTEQVIAGLMHSCTGWKLIAFSRPNRSNKIYLKRNEFSINYPGITIHHVRDFKEEKLGRGEDGLIITTGPFTIEANRHSLTAVEIIDGNRPVELFEKYR